MQSDCDDKRDISIHAPRKGSDHEDGSFTTAIFQFQSTPPARGATRFYQLWQIHVYISIHAPRKGSD